MLDKMRASQLFPYVRKESPSGVSLRGQALLMQTGMILAASPGVYTLGPLGLRVLKKVEQIIREEMNGIGALEVMLPILQEQAFWEETSRWEGYMQTGTMFTTKTTRGQSKTVFGLAPTAEELVVAWVRAYIESVKQLPLQIYQIGPKFRCEIRPRAGLLRGREFGMKDNYSFDVTEEGMRKAFQLNREAYTKAFERMGFRFISVQADSGAIGGQGSAEFMALCDDGDDTLLTCNNCDYGANQEKAIIQLHKPDKLYNVPHQDMEVVPTPNVRTVEELEEFFDMTAKQMVKTIIYLADNKPLAVCMRGDLEINEVKLANLVGATELGIADDQTVIEVTGAPVGFAGPVGLEGIPIYFDISVEGLCNFLCGRNEEDVHLVNVNIGRDVKEPDQYYDLHNAKEGHICGECGVGTLSETKGIEIGHVFMLQKGYAEKMGLEFMGEDGNKYNPWMGCYGIGTTRCVQAAAEQHADELGLCWPASIAPFHLVVIPANNKQDKVGLAERIWNRAHEEFELDVVLDDRDARFGVKMGDAEKIGYPFTIVVGRDSDKGLVELHVRKDKGQTEGKYQPKKVHVDELFATIGECMF